jgi:hypothetical protein
MHTENQLYELHGSALKVWVGGGGVESELCEFTMVSQPIRLILVD